MCRAKEVNKPRKKAAGIQEQQLQPRMATKGKKHPCGNSGAGGIGSVSCSLKLRDRGSGTEPSKEKTQLNRQVSLWFKTKLYTYHQGREKKRRLVIAGWGKRERLSREVKLN